MATGLAGFFQPESIHKPSSRPHEGYEELAKIGELLSEICEMQDHTSKDKREANGSSESASRDRLKMLRRQKASLFQKLEKILDEEPEIEDAFPSSASSSVAEKAGLYEELCQAKLRVKELEDNQVNFRRKFKEKVRALETENTDLKSKQLHTQGRETALSNQAELLREQKEILNQEAHSLRRFAENVGGETKVLNKQLTDLAAEIVEARKEALSLGDLLKENTAEKTLLQKQLDELSAKAEADLAALEREIAEAASKEEGLCQEIKSLQDECEAAKRSSEQQAEEVLQATSVSTQLAAQLKEVKMQVVDLQKAASSQEMHIEELSSQVHSLEKAGKRSAELEDSIDEYKSTEINLRSQLEELEKEKSISAESDRLAAEELRAKSDEVSSMLAEERARNEKLESSLVAKEREVSSLSQEIIDLQEHKETKDKLLAEARISEEASRTQLKALQEQQASEAGSLKTQIESLTADLKTTVEKGKNELKTKDNEILALRSELSTHEQRLASLESELAHKHEDASSVEIEAKAAAAKKEEELVQMRIKLKRSQDRVASLESSLNSSEDKEMLKKKDKQIASLTLKLENSNGVLKNESTALEEAFSNKLSLERNRSKQLEKELKLMEAELAKTEQRHSGLIAKLKETNDDFVKNLKLGMFEQASVVPSNPSCKAHEKEKMKLQSVAASNPKQDTLKRRKDRDLADWCRRRDGGFTQIGEITHSIRELEKLLMSSKLLPEEFLHKAGALYHEAVSTKAVASTGLFARRRIFVLTACALVLALICFVLFYSA